MSVVERTRLRVKVVDLCIAWGCSPRTVFNRLRPLVEDGVVSFEREHGKRFVWIELELDTEIVDALRALGDA